MEILKVEKNNYQKANQNTVMQRKEKGEKESSTSKAGFGLWKTKLFRPLQFKGALKGVIQRTKEEAINVAKTIRANHGRAVHPVYDWYTRKTYYYGKRFWNEGNPLPVRTEYTEYDVNAKIKGKGRDAERIVMGKNGRVYYTNDHYGHFVDITDSI